MMILLLLLLPFVHAGKKLTPEERKAFDEATKAIFHLTSFNYDDMIKTGTWAVFYGLRACTHCSRYFYVINSRFTPVWHELEITEPDVYKPVRLAKVECMKPEDRSVIPLCDFVNGFPSIYLHQDGVFKEEMMGDLNYNLTLQWLKDMRVKYTTLNTNLPNFNNVNNTVNANITKLKDVPKAHVKNEKKSLGLDQLKEFLAKEREPSPDVNPDGQIVHLTDDDFDEVF